MYSLMMVFTFPVLDRKQHFSANLFLKTKIISLNQNLVPRLIQHVQFNSAIYFLLF